MPTQDRITAIREALEACWNLPELNLRNYTEEDVSQLNNEAIKAAFLCKQALASLSALTKGEAPTVEEIMVDLHEFLDAEAAREDHARWTYSTTHPQWNEMMSEIRSRLTALFPVHQQPQVANAGLSDEEIGRIIDSVEADLRIVHGNARFDPSVFAHECLRYARDHFDVRSDVGSLEVAGNAQAIVHELAAWSRRNHEPKR